MHDWTTAPFEFDGGSAAPPLIMASHVLARSLPLRRLPCNICLSSVGHGRSVGHIIQKINFDHTLMRRRVILAFHICWPTSRDGRRACSVVGQLTYIASLPPSILKSQPACVYGYHYPLCIPFHGAKLEDPILMPPNRTEHHLPSAV